MSWPSREAISRRRFGARLGQHLAARVEEEQRAALAHPGVRVVVAAGRPARAPGAAAASRRPSPSAGVTVCSGRHQRCRPGSSRPASDSTRASSSTPTSARTIGRRPRPSKHRWRVDEMRGRMRRRRVLPGVPSQPVGEVRGRWMLPPSGAACRRRRAPAHPGPTARAASAAAARASRRLAQRAAQQAEQGRARSQSERRVERRQQRLVHAGLVAQRVDHRHAAGRAAARTPCTRQRCGVHQHARRGALVQPVALQAPRAHAEARPGVPPCRASRPDSRATISASTSGAG